jgi:hypothetical protein
MNCEEALERLQESLDAGGLPEAARDHVASCQACSVRAARLLEAHAALAAPEPVPSWTAALTRGVLLRLEGDARRERRLCLAAAVVVGLAAVLALSVLPEVPGPSSLAGLPERAREILPDLSDLLPGGLGEVESLLPLGFLVPLLLALLEGLRLAVAAARRSNA